MLKTILCSDHLIEKRRNIENYKRALSRHGAVIKDNVGSITISIM